MQIKHFMKAFALIGNVFWRVAGEQGQNAHRFENSQHFIVWAERPGNQFKEFRSALTALTPPTYARESRFQSVTGNPKSMATASTSAKRRTRQKNAEPQVSTIALPAMAEEHLYIPTLETWLWDAACAIRGAADAPKFKDFILPLVFFKRLSDVFDDEFAGQVA